ncbi:MAG: YdcF family protein, partial [Lachnospiraceae bacterium]|nr:YdcF family protein [Lachnospiraceae bacterium]
MYKKVKGGIAILLSIVIFVLYLPPVLLYGIINVGNLAGYLLAFCFLIYGVLQIHGQKVREEHDPSSSYSMQGSLVRTFNHDMGRETVLIQRGGLGRFISEDDIGGNNRSGRMWRKVMGWILFVLIMVLFLSVAVLMVRGTYHTPKAIAESVSDGSSGTSSRITSGADVTVILLGCGVRGERPTRMMRQRIETARVYLANAVYAKAILSGGKGDRENISEALCAYRYLTDPVLARKDRKFYVQACKRQGVTVSAEVPLIRRERLFIEDQSVDTEENMAFSKKIMEEKDLLRPVTVLVTQNFHEYRSQCLARSA